MFWRFGGYANISTLDSILDKPDVTTEELLEESDLIQELKQQNSKLIEFLRDEPVLKKLLHYVTTDKLPEGLPGKDKVESPKPESPQQERYSFFSKGKGRSRDKSGRDKDGEGETEQEKNEAQRKKYAYVACEVLSSEVWSITEAILEQQEALREFWQYIRRPAPLDPLQAGYFTKVNEALLDKKTAEMLAFFKSLDNIVPDMLQHVDCPMVMDLLLKIISLEKHEHGAGIVDWLQQQDLIPLLLRYLSAEHNSATQTSAGDFLKAIITISANATTQDQSVIGPNELTRQLVSEKCVSMLIGDMLRGGNPLTVGVGIIIEVIRKNNSDYDLDNQIGPEPKTSDPIYLGTLLRQFANHVPDFMHLIRSTSANKPPLAAAFGGKIEPLGFDRFKTCELMAELLHCSNMGLLNERGAEEEVKKRDVERERLKSEGKLGTPRPPGSTSDGERDGFSSSVDSHGFHHAGRPSDDEMDEKIGEDLASSEGGRTALDEDGFEEVKKPSTDDLPDEVIFDEIDDTTGEPTSLPKSQQEEQQLAPESDTSKQTPAPLKPNVPHFDPPPTRAVDSPTTAGVTDKIDKLDVDEDTVMTEFGEEPIDSDEDGPSELEIELAKHHAEDKPAPLFARRQDSLASADAPTDDTEEAHTDIDESVATIQGEQAPTTNGERAPYETEEDGSSVVGDLLKIQFVDHQVVPTILDFFFRFPWNNFLHNVVYDIVQQVFNGTLERGYNRTLAFDLFSPVTAKDGASLDTLGLISTKDITDRILDGQKASDASQTERGMRLGYMGHLTLIAEEICKFGTPKPPDPLDATVLDRVNREEWIQYVDGPLAETREKDNAVLGGVRPQDAVSGRPLSMAGLSGGFTANTANTLASAGIGAGMASQDGFDSSGDGGGQGFEINSGTMLSGFGDGDDDEDMEDDGDRREESRSIAFTDDEQQMSPEQIATGSASTTTNNNNSIPSPLNMTSARRRLARRLEAKKAQATASSDPDAADSLALETAEQLHEEPREGMLDLDSAEDFERESLRAGEGVRGGEGLQITGLRTVGGIGGSASRFSGLFAGSDDDDDEEEEESSSGSSGAEREEEQEGDSGAGESFDEDEAGRDETLGRPEGDYEDPSAGSTSAPRRVFRRTTPSTTQAQHRTPLDADDDEDDEDDSDEAANMGQAFEARMALHREGPFADPVDVEEGTSSSEDELVEIRPRRTS